AHALISGQPQRGLNRDCMADKSKLKHNAYSLEPTTCRGENVTVATLNIAIKVQRDVLICDALPAAQEFAASFDILAHFKPRRSWLRFSLVRTLRCDAAWSRAERGAKRPAPSAKGRGSESERPKKKKAR